MWVTAQPEHKHLSHGCSMFTKCGKIKLKKSQMFANIRLSKTVFSEHLFDVCEDSSECEKRLCLLCKIDKKLHLCIWCKF